MRAWTVTLSDGERGTETDIQPDWIRRDERAALTAGYINTSPYGNQSYLD
ncbi:hypothetical protein NJ7G_4112 [Natrinema sp. J7-2]|nr:hypothetical protein NJ7G_4112 [Natrinema sp. J7-2]